MPSTSSSPECRLFEADGRHCLTHPNPGNVDGECCECGIAREELEPTDSLPRGGAEGVHVHKWDEWGPGPRLSKHEYANCLSCGASKVRRAEPEKPQERVCGICEGSHGTEACKGLEEPERDPEDTCCDNPQDGVYGPCDCPEADRRRTVLPIPRRPPYAVAYAVEGGAQYELAVSGDATVVAEDGVLMVLHPKKPVLAIVRIQPMNMEEEAPDGA